MREIRSLLVLRELHLEKIERRPVLVQPNNRSMTTRYNCIPKLKIPSKTTNSSEPAKTSNQDVIMSKGERMKATAKYRQTISNLPKPDPLDWARLIMSRMADGDFILPIQERMAKEALWVE